MRRIVIAHDGDLTGGRDLILYDHDGPVALVEEVFYLGHHAGPRIMAKNRAEAVDLYVALASVLGLSPGLGDGDPSPLDRLGSHPEALPSQEAMRVAHGLEG